MKSADRREQTIQNYAAWLRQFPWAWYATLKLTSGAPSLGRVEMLADRWLSEMHAQEGGEDFRWVRVRERGRMGTNPHFHVLLGGLRNRMRFWQAKWNGLGGDAVITRYDPQQNGLLYLLKSVDDQGDLIIDCDLPQERSTDGKRNPDSEQSRTPSKLRIDGIDDETRPSDLRQLFRRFGRVLEVGVIDARVTSDRTLTFGYVIMAGDDAEDAMEELDNRDWRGEQMRVSRMRS